MSKKRMKLREFSQQQGIAYGTAYKYWRAGRIEGIQLPTKTILVSGWKEGFDAETIKRAILYARVSDPKQRQDLGEQIKGLRAYAMERDYTIIEAVEEIGPGLSTSRSKLLDLLHRDDWDILIVENKETAFKFGFDYMQAALSLSGRNIEYRTHLQASAENVLVALLHNTGQVVGKLLGVGHHKRQILEAIKRLEA